MSEIEDLQLKLRQFAKARDWEPYHSPRNLILAIGSELGELQAEVRWQTDEEIRRGDSEFRERVASEMADISIFLLRLFDVMNFDFSACIETKLSQNEIRGASGPNLKKL